jgi:hypothetical protein
MCLLLVRIRSPVLGRYGTAYRSYVLCGLFTRDGSSLGERRGGVLPLSPLNISDFGPRGSTNTMRFHIDTRVQWTNMRLYVR